MLEILDKINLQSLSEANLQFQAFSMVFLFDELADAQKVNDMAKDAARMQVLLD